MQLGPSYASPFDFANSVINAAAGQAAIWYGLSGFNSTVSAGEASGLAALAYATDLIRAGRSSALLAGGAEELCFESFLGHFRAGRLGGAQGDGEDLPIPFHPRRNGFALSEGAALLLLEDAASAEGRGVPVLAEVLGHGAAFAPRRTREDSAGAVARAVRLALEDAGVGAEGVDVLSVSANGSVDGDLWEALGVAEALGSHAADLPVTAIKSLLGEALGASGGLQAVALLGTLGDGALPGIPGLDLDAGFPLRGVHGRDPARAGAARPGHGAVGGRACLRPPVGRSRSERVSGEPGSPPRPELVPRFDEGYGAEAVEARRRWVEERTGARLTHVGASTVPSEDMRGNIENPSAPSRCRSAWPVPCWWRASTPRVPSTFRSPPPRGRWCAPTSAAWWPSPGPAGPPLICWRTRTGSRPSSCSTAWPRRPTFARGLPALFERLEGAKPSPPPATAGCCGWSRSPWGARSSFISSTRRPTPTA